MRNGTAPQHPHHRRRLSFFYVVMLLVLTTAGFLTLSEYLLVCSNGILFVRQDLLFESDAANFLKGMVSEQWISPFHTFSIVHPLAAYFWKAIAFAGSFLLGLWMPHDVAAVMAVRLMIAIVAGAGTTCLVLLANHHGISKWNLIPLFAMYFLFTSNIITALPDHFGLSSGLLSITFWVLYTKMKEPLQWIVLCLMAFLVIGTTITNFLLPALCVGFALHHAKHFNSSSLLWRYRIPILIAFLMIAFGSVALLVASKAIGFVKNFSNNRLVEEPGRAVVYAAAGILYPAVGAIPEIRMQQAHPAQMVTYEPVRLQRYHPVQITGAVAWLSLFILSVYRAMKERATRPYVYLLLIWITFNLIFHNLWGDEFFLFTPHWAWALMTLVLLGARNISFRLLILFVLPILIAQVYTLVRVGDAVKLIRY